jgi:hypothetical protein
MVKRYPGSPERDYVMKGGKVVGYVGEADGLWSAYRFTDPPKGSSEPGDEELLGSFPSMMAALAAFA